MQKTKVSDVLLPLNKISSQAYFGKTVHTLGLIRWILEQTGPAVVYISTFSTSDEFLRGFYNIRKDNLIKNAVLLADFKAWKKTDKLLDLVKSCFDEVYLGKNHSKLILIENDKYNVTAVSSQNQTYGDRAEATIIETDIDMFHKLLKQFVEINNSSYALFKRPITKNSIASESVDAGI